ncbi:MAG: NADH-quinone oxidoreductase subunit I [Chloroflexi bacterium]|nr:NADH-quinone oxidoreductase subunit I [Chloroflexota bacterium]
MYGLGILSGLLVTMRNFLRPATTVQYPEQRVVQHPRFRGEEFVWYEERCTGCAVCAKYCPLGIIKIVTEPGGTLMAEGQSYAIDTFDIDIARCMFCGLCVEACPYDALFMGSGFEEATYSRKDLVITVDRLRSADKHPSTWFRPQLESKGYDPHKDPSLPWEMAGREPWPYHLPQRPGPSNGTAISSDTPPPPLEGADSR